MLNLAPDFSAGRKLQELVTDLEKQGITSESCLMRVNASLEEGRFPPERLMTETIYCLSKLKQMRKAGEDLFSQISDGEMPDSLEHLKTLLHQMERARILASFQAAFDGILRIRLNDPGDLSDADALEKLREIQEKVKKIDLIGTPGENAVSSGS